MKTDKKIFAAIVSSVVAVCLTFALWAGWIASPDCAVTANAETANAAKPLAYDEESGAYAFHITSYVVEMDVHSDRTIDVKEVITAKLLGYDSHGIIRDFPLGKGVTYSNICATCDSSDFEPYFETDDTDFLSYYLWGDLVAKGELRTYTLTYTMSVPKLKNSGELPLNVVGYGWQSTNGIGKFSATVRLPADARYSVQSGKNGTQENECGVSIEQIDRTLVLTAEELPNVDRDEYGNKISAGVTLSLYFADGVLSSKIDYTLLVTALAALFLLAGGLMILFLFTKKPPLIATVNLTAPEEMDPLHMGKLIDNSVDNEDIGAIVFWFADQGYLTIDMSQSEDNPTLYRTEKLLPASAPAHQRLMLEGLFRNGTSTKISDLENTFYHTADRVKMTVPTVPEGIYSQESKLKCVLFGLASVLILGLIPLFSSMIAIKGYVFFLSPILAAVGFLIAFIGSWIATDREYKWKKEAQWIVRLLAAGIGGLIGLFGLLVPSATFSEWVTVTAGVGGAALGLLSGEFLVRTKRYAEILGQIVGFKNFILYTEKDKIKFMLQENPALYYRILPYAQVLGVTNEWTDKFKGLTMPAPAYANYGGRDVLLDCIMWNSMFRSLNHGMSAKMVSRPSSNGNGGSFGGGGFGGGFGGGGFGGGGGRGC